MGRHFIDVWAGSVGKNMVIHTKSGSCIEDRADVERTLWFANIQIIEDFVWTARFQFANVNTHTTLYCPRDTQNWN